jgi:hypothetical protein
MALSNYTPSDTFPDLDGGGGDGPLQFPASGDPYTYEVHYIGSGGTALKHGLFGKIINGLYWLKNHMLPLAGGTMTGDVTAKSIVIPDTETLQMQPGSAITVAAHSGGTAAAAISCAGLMTLEATGSGADDGVLRVKSDTMIDAQAGSIVNLLGRTRISAPKDLSDASHILWDSVTDSANHIRMLTGPAGNRILTLPEPAAWATSTGYTSGTSVVKANGNVYLCSQTGTSASSGTGPSTTGTNIVDGSCKWDFQGLAPIAGDWFEVTVFLGTSAYTVGLQRAGSSDYVCVIGDGAGVSPWASSNITGTGKVRFDGTHWHLLSAAGSAFSGADS